jgi:hypothetical protein
VRARPGLRRSPRFRWGTSAWLSVRAAGVRTEEALFAWCAHRHLTVEQKARFPQVRYDEMMTAYIDALPRFTSKRNPDEPRSEWCAVSLYKRAKEVDRLGLYTRFYGPASSIDHLDFGTFAAGDAPDCVAP